MITSKSRSTFSDHKDFKTLFNSTEMGQFKDEVYGILDCNNIHISINSKILIKGKIEDLIQWINQKSRSCSSSESVAGSGILTYDKYQ